MRLRSLLIIVALLSAACFAQRNPPRNPPRNPSSPRTTPVYTRPVQGNLFLPPGTPATNSLERIQLMYCGGNAGRVPAAPGSPPGTPATIVSFQPFDVRVQADGSWTTDLYGNDQIICGTDSGGNSRWRMKPVFNGVSGPAVDYEIQSCGTTLPCLPFSPDNAPQCSVVITTNCAVSYPYTTPPPPPVVGPPGPMGPPGPAGPPGAGGGVNPGTQNQIAFYLNADGLTVSGDPRFTDDSSTLSYTGDTYVSGSSTIDTEVLVQGPYWMDTPAASSPIGAASAGRSAIGVSNDGNFYISANAGTPHMICTNTDTTCNAGHVQVNGQTINSGGTGNVNAGAASHSIALNEGNGNPLTGLALGLRQFPVGTSGVSDPVAFTLPVCSAGQVLTYTSGTSLTCTSAGGTGEVGFAEVQVSADQAVAQNTNTDVTDLVKTITIPAACTASTPCRALVSYSLFLSTGNSGIVVSWVHETNDTRSFASAQNLVTGAATNYGIQATEVSPYTYTTGSTKTFQVRIECSNAGGLTVKKFSNNSGTMNQQSWFQITFLTSNGASL